MLSSKLCAIWKIRFTVVWNRTVIWKKSLTTLGIKSSLGLLWIWTCIYVYVMLSINCEMWNYISIIRPWNKEPQQIYKYYAYSNSNLVCVAYCFGVSKNLHNHWMKFLLFGFSFCLCCIPLGKSLARAPTCVFSDRFVETCDFWHDKIDFQFLGLCKRFPGDYFVLENIF